MHFFELNKFGMRSFSANYLDETELIFDSYFLSNSVIYLVGFIDSSKEKYILELFFYLNDKRDWQI